MLATYLVLKKCFRENATEHVINIYIHVYIERESEETICWKIRKYIYYFFSFFNIRISKYRYTKKEYLRTTNSVCKCLFSRAYNQQWSPRLVHQSTYTNHSLQDKFLVTASNSLYLTQHLDIENNFTFETRLTDVGVGELKFGGGLRRAAYYSLFVTKIEICKRNTFCANTLLAFMASHRALSYHHVLSTGMVEWLGAPLPLSGYGGFGECIHSVISIASLPVAPLPVWFYPGNFSIDTSKNRTTKKNLEI